MIALGGPKLKLHVGRVVRVRIAVSMIALGGPKLKLSQRPHQIASHHVSMIALGGPKLKRVCNRLAGSVRGGFNDSTGWA